MINRGRKAICLLTIVILVSLISGCSVLDDIAVKFNIKNNKFEYIKENKVDKIIIQNVRDSGFKFIVNDSQAINDIYNILKKGKIVSEKSDIDPDYIFEIWMGDEEKTYNYIVGENEKGNFYNDTEAFSIPKTLENTIMQNLSFIRKPREFEYIYYESILDVIKNQKSSLGEKSKVGINISDDTDCLKYIFSTDLIDFEERLKKELVNAELVGEDLDKYDAIITVKNRGYSTSVFKTLINIDDRKNKIYEDYYIEAEYNYKDWDINISEANEQPAEW